MLHKALKIIQKFLEASGELTNVIILFKSIQIPFGWAVELVQSVPSYGNIEDHLHYTLKYILYQFLTRKWCLRFLIAWN